MKKSHYSKLLASILCLLFLCGFVQAAPLSITETAFLKRIDTGTVKLATRIVPGKSIPILFIHGSWDDHNGWIPVAESLQKKRNNQIILYDRRGHSASTDVSGQGHISGDVDDAVKLIQKIHSGPVHVAGHSYGANIAISLTNKHPELVASLFLYEPPAFGVLKKKEKYTPLLKEVKASMTAAKALLETGDIEEGTIAFVENVAFGKNSWRGLFDERTRNCMVSNADTWLDQSRDKERLLVRADKLSSFKKQITLVYGGSSLPVYQAIAAEMQELVPALHIHQCKGAGHGGPISHPDRVADFLDAHISFSDKLKK